MDSLFSDQWYRVAQRRPSLRANVRVRRHLYRGQLWYLLIDEGSDRSFRIDEAAYAFIGRCDGRTPAQLIWDAISDTLGERAPSQDALLRLMVRLQASGLLHFDRQTDIASLFPTRREQFFLRGKKLNPLAFRVRLGNPTRILKPLAPLGALLFQPAMLWLWGAIVGFAGLLALFELDGLGAHASSLLGRPQNLWLAWGLYPLVKLVHELAHGLAVRRWQGEVHEWGLAVLVLMPVPYVDASAATAFRHRLQRAAVSAAGIMAELLIAALALAVWLVVQPGLVRDGALTVMLICAFSTVLVNGNPLMRFDGYFVLTDLLELPNLAPRSAQWWRTHLRSVVQRLPSANDIAPAPGESVWLALYQPLSWLYRLLLVTGIIIWLGGLVAWLGYAVGVWFAWSVLVRPLLGALRALFDPHLPESARLRSRGAGAALVAVLTLGIFVLPVPDVTVAEGVVWLPDEARVRNETAGFVAEIHRSEGDYLKAGDLILRLEDDELHAERDRIASERDGMRAAMFDKLRSDAAVAGQLARRVEQAERELARLEQQIAGLEVRARKDGTLVLPRGSDLPGRHLPRGEEIGALLDGGPTRVRVVVPDGEATRLQALAGVTVSLSDARGEVLAARLDGELPGARRQLPSAALGRPAGGGQEVDPADPNGLTTLAALVWVDLVLTDWPQQLAGGRALARFEHPDRPIASQLLRGMRQLVLGRFEPEAIAWP